MRKKSVINRKYLDEIEEIKTNLKNCYDITYRRIDTEVGEITAIFIDSMSNIDLINNYAIRPLMKQDFHEKSVDFIKNSVIEIAITEYVHSFDEVLQHILAGNLVIIFSFAEEIIYCETKAYSNRAIEEPPTESVFKGPREGFTENINDNISLLRRRLRSPKLKLENINVGKGSHTTVIMVYLEGEAP